MAKNYVPIESLRDATRRGERPLLDRSSIWTLGPDLELIECELICSVSASGFILDRFSMIDTSFLAQKPLQNLSWSSVRIQGCRFTGRFVGCDFGGRSLPNDPKSEFGSITDSDFRDSRLHLCRFFNADLSTIQFPNWPCYTIIDYPAAIEDFSRCSFLADGEEYADSLWGDPEESEIAITLDFETEKDELGCSSVEFRKFLLGKSYVR
jgi:hypothetical protein